MIGGLLRIGILLGIALVYWVAPADLIPDSMPFVGRVDDTIVAIFCFMKVLR